MFRRFITALESAETQSQRPADAAHCTLLFSLPLRRPRTSLKRPAHKVIPNLQPSCLAKALPGTCPNPLINKLHANEIHLWKSFLGAPRALASRRQRWRVVCATLPSVSFPSQDQRFQSLERTGSSRQNAIPSLEGFSEFSKAHEKRSLDFAQKRTLPSRA